MEKLLEADGFIKFFRMGPLYDIEEGDTSDAAVVRKPTRPAKVPTAPRRAPMAAVVSKAKLPAATPTIRQGTSRKTHETAGDGPPRRALLV